ncbi:hypothetical protein OROHE_014112 [Orobanche hederae]
MSDALINGLAGAGGGIIAQLITYPLQTVNTRQQTERDPNKEKRKLGTLEQMSQVVKQEGWGRLYGGLAPSVVGTAASQMNNAESTALEQKKKGMGDGSVGMLSSLMVAALSGCVNTHTKKSQPNCIGSPSPEEVIVAAVEPPPFGTTHAIQEVYDEAGVLGFWKGVFPTLIMVMCIITLVIAAGIFVEQNCMLRQVSNPAIQFMLYETFLKKLKRRRLSSSKGTNDVTALEIFLLGALAKFGATVLTYPVLVVKSRLQAKQITGGDKRHQYRGTLDAILKMIRNEGFYGFYQGMGTKIVQSVLAAAVLFMVKEELVRGSRWLLTKGAVDSVKPKPH